MSLTTILAGIPPPDDLQKLQAAHHAVEQQAGDPDNDHSGHHQVVAISGVAGVDDQIPQPGPESYHFGCDDDEPGHAETDPHSDDDLRKDGRDDDLEKELGATDAEVLRGPDIFTVDRMHAIGGLHDRREYRREENKKNRRQVSDTEPKNRQGNPGD